MPVTFGTGRRGGGPSTRAAINGTTPGTQIYHVGSVQKATGPETSRHLCGSVIIEDYWVLTAKQCNNQQPPATVQHTVNVGSAGRHKVLAVWNIGDTAMAFYSCIDINAS